MIQAQASAVMNTNPARTIRRSRRRELDDRRICGHDRLHSAALDDTMVVEVQAGELTVAVLEIKLDLALCGRSSTAHLGNLVLEPMRNIDANTMLSARRRIPDRLASAVSPLQLFNSSSRSGQNG